MASVKEPQHQYVSTQIMIIPANASLLALLESPNRFLFFTGKGGVGKTSMACASAIALADRGNRVLLVSTDPASNLDEVLGVELSSDPTEVPGVPGLAALNIDPAAAAHAYREKLVGPYRGKLPEALLRSMEEQLSDAASFLGGLPVFQVSLRSDNLVGLAALRALKVDVAPQRSVCEQKAIPALRHCLSLAELVDSLALAGHGVVMTMGKGGVGKTTIAAAIGAELARRGFKVCLSTTDPAAHVAAAAGQIKGLVIDRIDPRVETQRYVEFVLATAGLNLDAGGRALLEEDLRSPCTEEIAVFRAFARTVAQGKDSFVVLDTAPTGHTLLLLDATESYHREIAKRASDLPEEVRELLPRLRDPLFTHVLVVTLPEPTPVHEAAMLQTDLRRAGIEPFAWIINQSFSKTSVRDPLLIARANGEIAFIREVVEVHSRRTVIVPWVVAEPVGPDGLGQLI